MKGAAIAAGVVALAVADRAAAGPLDVAIHGFVSEGGFVSTSNDYLGASSRGSLELFEAGLNFSTEVTDRLRVGVQLFTRDIGVYDDDSPRVDWAYLDYRWRRWLGVRAGVIKMPFGLYNEYADVDAARMPILMPQGVYPVRNREALLAHRGIALYGNHELGTAGELDYQVWLGSLSIPTDALTLSGATLDSIDTKYVTGAQLFWQTPLEGLRIGASYLEASIDFRVRLDAKTTALLIMLGAVPADYDGTLVVSQRPTRAVVASAEYTRGNWMVAAEYDREPKRQRTSLPAVVPTFEEDREKFYLLASYQAAPVVAVSGYYSVHHVDAGDRRGHDPKYRENFDAWQRDLAATVRFDVNDHWLWKIEAHFVDGTADLDQMANPTPDRYWGLVLVKTTVTF